MINRRSFITLSTLAIMTASVPFSFASDKPRRYTSIDFDSESIALIEEMRSPSNKDNFNVFYDTVMKSDKSDIEKAQILIEGMGTELRNNTSIEDKGKIVALIDNAFKNAKKKNLQEISVIGNAYLDVVRVYSTSNAIYPKEVFPILGKVTNSVLPALKKDNLLQYQLSTRAIPLYLSFAQYRLMQENSYSVAENVMLSEQAIDDSVVAIDKYLPSINPDQVEKRKPAYPYSDNIKDYDRAMKLYFLLAEYSKANDVLTDGKLSEYQNKAFAAFEKINALGKKAKVVGTPEEYFYLVMSFPIVYWVKGADYTVANVLSKLPDEIVQDPKTGESMTVTYKDVGYTGLSNHIRKYDGDTEADAFLEKYGKDFTLIPQDALNHLVDK